METINYCPQCGAAWRDGLTCQDHFHQALSWESEYPDQTRAVHHLLVLCYHLQHPLLYSPQGLEEAKRLLVAFVEQQVAPRDMRRRLSGAVDSGKRAWKITGTPDSHGAYVQPLRWPITVGDITAGDLDGYIERVQAWARSALEALKASGNLAASVDATANQP
ncbi:MAG TPA: DUF5946 family protein [Ktedonobacterales bacterium]|nr:DUF5946 family protein [Ktedonobacterales bacterium]